MDVKVKIYWWKRSCYNQSFLNGCGLGFFVLPVFVFYVGIVLNTKEEIF